MRVFLRPTLHEVIKVGLDLKIENSVRFSYNVMALFLCQLSSNKTNQTKTFFVQFVLSCLKYNISGCKIHI